MTLCKWFTLTALYAREKIKISTIIVCFKRFERKKQNTITFFLSTSLFLILITPNLCESWCYKDIKYEEFHFLDVNNSIRVEERCAL